MFENLIPVPTGGNNILGQDKLSIEGVIGKGTRKVLARMSLFD
jgi:hypothetical protein